MHMNGINQTRVQQSLRDLDVTQETEWDCGLAVARAILRIKNCPFESIDAPCRSLWTVELVLLLCKYGAGDGIVFMTTYCGVNPNHKKCLKFYSNAMGRHQNEEDIEQAFDIARNIGVTITQRKVSDEELETVLMNGTHVVVVLVDAALLMGEEEGGHFLGHYILLYGFDSSLDVFLAKNPNSSSLNDHIHKTRLHKARMQYGTDDDIIFVPV